jgi:hypothetical protein
MGLLHLRDKRNIIAEHYRNCVDRLRLVHLGTRAFPI